MVFISKYIAIILAACATVHAQAPSDAEIETTTRRKTQEVLDKSREELISCSQAPHPGNCNSCINANEMVAASQVAACVLAAAGVAATTGGLGIAVAGVCFIACEAVVTTTLGQSNLACVLR